jgi:hypothetical protein
LEGCRSLFEVNVCVGQIFYTKCFGIILQSFTDI